MRILLVSDFLPPVRGGVEFHVITLAEELSRLGHQVHVATLTHRPDSIGEGVTVHPIRSAASALPHRSPDRPFHPPIPDVVARSDLRRLLSEIRPDIIHAHSWLAVSLPKYRPPLIYTAHDYGLFCPIRTLIRPTGDTCGGPGLLKCAACGTGQYGKSVSTALSVGTPVGRRLIQADEFVAVSGFVAERLTPILGRRPTVIHNFVPSYLGSNQNIDKDKFPNGRFVMFAGDPGAHKGADDLLDLWKSSQRPNAELLIATTRPIAQLNIEGVRQVSLTRAEVMAAWRQASVAVVPSRWPDPCPTVVLEALQSGTPIVTYRVGGIPELVRDKLDGFVIEPGNKEKFGAAVRRLIDDVDLCVEMGLSARRASKHFTAATCVAELVTLYERSFVGAVAVAADGRRSP